MSTTDQLEAFSNKCHKCDTSQNTGCIAFKVCGRCKKVQYCSKECQRDHWPSHKLKCVHFMDTKLSPFEMNIAHLNNENDKNRHKILIADKFITNELSKITGTQIASAFALSSKSQSKSESQKVTADEYYTIIAKTIRFYRLCVAIPEDLANVPIERCYVTHFAKKCLDKILEGKGNIPKTVLDSLEFQSVLNCTPLDMDETYILNALSTIVV